VTWIRLLVLVEGQSEETFVRDLIAPELLNRRVSATPILLGGVTGYARLKRDLVRLVRHDQSDDARFTTMIDLFRLPQDFPGLAAAAGTGDPLERAEELERYWHADVGDHRFIPYIQVHEFEALVFSDPKQILLAHPGRMKEAGALAAVRAGYASPEHIDDGPATAPSKRILALVPGYSKPTSSALILRSIGLARLRQECAHFNQWLTRLEGCGRME
jgi:hypothetical protein